MKMKRNNSLEILFLKKDLEEIRNNSATIVNNVYLHRISNIDKLE